MLQKHKIFLHLAAALVFCACLAGATAAHARSAAEIAAVFNSGVAAYDAGDYRKALSRSGGICGFSKDLAAMRNLAMMLRKGQGVAKDPEQAEEIYLRAAEAGLPTAQADLADMYLKGEVRTTQPGARPATAGGSRRGQSSGGAISTGRTVRNRRAAAPGKESGSRPPALRLCRQARHAGSRRAFGLPGSACRGQVQAGASKPDAAATGH